MGWCEDERAYLESALESLAVHSLTAPMRGRLTPYTKSSGSLRYPYLGSGAAAVLLNSPLISSMCDCLEVGDAANPRLLSDDLR